MAFATARVRFAVAALFAPHASLHYFTQVVRYRSDGTLDPTWKPPHLIHGYGAIISKPEQGHHLVAVVVELELVSGTFNDAPSDGAQLVDGQHDQLDADIGSEVKEVPTLGGQLKLMPGDKRVGAITFTIPNGTMPAEFLFTTDSGFGNTGEWSLISFSPG